MEQNIIETNLLNGEKQKKKERVNIRVYANQQQQTDNSTLYNNTEQTGDLQSSDIPQHPLPSNNEKFVDKNLIKQKKTESMKRIRCLEKWKVNIKKNARLKGEEYIGVGGKLVPAKKMGQPCTCRLHCAEKISEKEREELYRVFWNTWTWQQRKQFIAFFVKEMPKQRTRLRRDVYSDDFSQSRRQMTFTYSLPLKDDFITVCKSMFLSTFAVSKKFVRHVMDKKRASSDGIVGSDLRGRHTPKSKKSENVRDRVREHIRSFSTEKSTDPDDRSGRRYLDSSFSIAAMHKVYLLKCKQEDVPESDIVKESYYREIFKTEFNIGFKRAQTKEKKSPPKIS